ncbi:hypothetical protein ARTSIC4J27_684 [Pseudarthrobacter siccitolerans]|jgi:hypothetical protein|uniref:Uncharacterized protein n=1 Tax=Pseudarthrobacter siccitolerans TaxID=861266 RepID=A0A024GXR5_9MICC|nr:hypothetical protein [Pseudarthrobacter siccitolerans]MCU1567017.1 hypothetical protein [Pseudarthrobacter sp.]CCQ44755.1 hypothetical protein ARTSIC4J27_684 [Pseudarthrobacter siccitolerans]
MLKKIAAAAALAGALAFTAAAPAVLSAGSIADTENVAVARTGNWPDPMSKPVKDKNTDTTYTTYTGNWPDPM